MQRGEPFELWPSEEDRDHHYHHYWGIIHTMRIKWENAKYDQEEKPSADTADSPADSASSAGQEGAALERELLSKGGRFPTLKKPNG